MKPVRRNLVLAFASLLLAAIALGLWATTHAPAPQIITLPNGQQYRFAGVTYSRDNVPPSMLARIVPHLPLSWTAHFQKYIVPRISQFNQGQTFAEPQLFVWFERAGSNLPPVSATPMLAFFSVATGPMNINPHYLDMRSAALVDNSGHAAGVQSMPYFGTNATWSYVSFPILPRRSRTLDCIFYSYINPYYGTEGFEPFAKVSFRNPAYQKSPQWQPEPVPTTKQSDTLQVRLEQVTYENPYAQPTNTPAHWPQTAVAYTMPLAQGWALVKSELSDATGNVLTSLPIIPGGPAGIGTASPRLRKAVGFTDRSQHVDYFDGVLWPDEQAWRLKLEFKPNSSQDSQTQITFTNIALPPFGSSSTNAFTNSQTGRPIVLKNVDRTEPLGGFGSLFSPSTTTLFEISGKPAGQALNLVRAETDARVASGSGQYEFKESTYFKLSFIPTNATRMDLTFDLQKTRVVEFTFKPPPPLGGSTNP